MAFYRICPDCGAYLDPGEQCSCHEEHLIEMERKEKATACIRHPMIWRDSTNLQSKEVPYEACCK